MSLFAVVEIMGRRTRAGVISDATMGGATLLRIEHPTLADHTGEDPLAEYYAPSAIFAIRPCSVEEATAVAGWAWPGRVPATPSIGPAFDDLIDDDDDEERGAVLMACPVFALEPDARWQPTYNPWECRPDKDYDDQYPATLLMPNGSQVCSPDRPFLNVAARLVFEAHQSNCTEHHDEGGRA